MQINCSPAWQWEQAKNGSVEFDADIVGPGVIASFISAAFTAVLTLFVAFTTYSIPAELINDADQIIAQALRLVFCSLRTKLRIPKISRTDGEEAREDRLHAVQTFMLSISDQVLASEMAILIATFAKFEDITIYSVNVIVALGCLAATVHLAMMPLLVRSMREHHVIKASRSVSMVIAAVMLVFLLVLQMSDKWRDGTHIYMQCAFDDYQMNAAELAVNWINFTAQLLVPIFILYGNYEVIQLLYSKNHGPAEDSRPNNATIEPRKGNRILRLYKEQRSIRTYSVQSKIRRQWARHRAVQIIKRGMPLRKQRHYAFMISEEWAFFECQECFLWRILWLLSATVYGVTDVVLTRDDTEGISGDRDSMGYGQIVPLVLLILPIFAAMQSIYDYRDRTRTLKQNELAEESVGHELAEILEDHAESRVSQEPSINSERIDGEATEPIPEPVTRSTTTAMQNVISTTIRRRNSMLSSSPTLNNESIPGVFSPPTLDQVSDDQAFQAGIDRSLWKWVRQDNYEEMPFVRGITCGHASFMLLFAILLGFLMAAGDTVLVLPLYCLLLLIVARRTYGLIYFWKFAREHGSQQPGNQGANQPGSDNSQAIMHAHGADAATADDDEV
ncbi:hypothetical protein BDV18DRAFT_156078 [Aspergillus unguis]